MCDCNPTAVTYRTAQTVGNLCLTVYWTSHRLIINTHTHTHRGKIELLPYVVARLNLYKQHSYIEGYTYVFTCNTRSGLTGNHSSSNSNNDNNNCNCNVADTFACPCRLAVFPLATYCLPQSVAVCACATRQLTCWTFATVCLHVHQAAGSSSRQQFGLHTIYKITPTLAHS